MLRQHRTKPVCGLCTQSDIKALCSAVLKFSRQYRTKIVRQ
ncbi:hypothetical protein RUMCAL_03283, partial [Ruminococcus callidus ATCC 27760]